MYGFQNIVQDLEHIVSSSDSYSEIINRGADSLRNLLNNPDLISEQEIMSIAYGHSDSMVYKSIDNNFVIQIFTWESRMATEIHDHFTWGLMGIYKNVLGINEYVLLPLDQYGTYDLTESQSFMINEGDVCYVLPPNEEIHKVYNPSDNLSVSIHIYGKSINEYNVYDIENGRIIKKAV